MTIKPVDEIVRKIRDCRRLAVTSHLRPDGDSLCSGLALVEAPLCYPTHDWPYDFHRFTLAGLRVLMRGFDCVAMGPAVGPGSAAALAFRDFLVSLAPPRARWQVPMRLIASLATFWWKWLDRPASRRPAGLGASAGFFFLGARRETPLSRKISFLPSCSSSGSDDG